MRFLRGKNLNILILNVNNPRAKPVNQNTELRIATEQWKEHDTWGQTGGFWLDRVRANDEE